MLFFIQYQHYVEGHPWMDWDMATSYPQAAKIMRRAEEIHNVTIPWRILVRFPKQDVTGSAAHANN